MNGIPDKAARELEGRRSPSCARVRDWLVEYIAREKLQAGDRMPSERALADVMGFSRATVAKAVSELVEQRLLVRQQRSGTFVGGGGRAESRRDSGARTIGIVIPWLTDETAGHVSTVIDESMPCASSWRETLSLEIMRGAVTVLNEHGYRFLVLANNDAKAEDDVLARLPKEELDGVLVVPYNSLENQPAYAKLVEDGLPVVFVDRYCPAVRADWVATDNYGAAKSAVRHMVDRGHRRIAFFTDFDTVTSVQDRTEGYKAGLKDAGIAYDDSIVCGPEMGRHGFWRLNHSLEHCMTIPDPVTAVFCMNDLAVLATLDAAQNLGIKVPDELEVIGFFDDHCSSDVRSLFIGVRQDPTRMGLTAAQFLVDKISGNAPAQPRQVLLPAEIVPAYYDAKVASSSAAR